MQFYNHITSSDGREVILNGWKAAGIYDAVRLGSSFLQSLDPFQDILPLPESGHNTRAIVDIINAPDIGITIPRNYPERAIMSQNDPERAIMIIIHSWQLFGGVLQEEFFIFLTQSSLFNRQRCVLQGNSASWQNCDVFYKKDSEKSHWNEQKDLLRCVLQTFLASWQQV